VGGAVGVCGVGGIPLFCAILYYTIPYDAIHAMGRLIGRSERKKHLL